jgi:pimeloyl-ACP methyl ester carboxylesterase
LADQFRGSLDDRRVFDDHQRVVFVSHSMGGLVVRQFLLTKRERLAKMLYFYATPTNGSELTNAAHELSNNPQLRGMLPLEGNELLQSIQSGWLGWDAVKNLPSYCAYETLPTFGVMVVSMSSATALCNEDLDPIAANHVDIVKPKDRYDPRYTRLTHALRSVLSSLYVPK